MTDSKQDEQRAAFEAWAAPIGFRCHWIPAANGRPEGYRSVNTNHAWSAWQAATSSMQAQVEALRADAERYAFVLDCDFNAARKYLPDLDEQEFKAKRRAAIDAFLQVEEGGAHG